MNAGFFINTSLPLALVLVLCVLNLLKPGKESIHYSYGALGIAVAAAITLFILITVGIIPSTNLFIGIFSFFNWLTAVLYMSFMLDLTASRRFSRFYLAYILPTILAVVTVIIPRTIGLYVIAAAGSLILFFFTVSHLLAWIKSATDDRSRRDGEWMTLLFLLFFIALIGCLTSALDMLFWLFAVWYLVMYSVIHLQKIFKRLTNIENKLIIDNIFDILIILDAKGKIVRLNRRGYQITGQSFVTITGNGIETLFHHPDLQAANRGEWLEKYGWMDTGYGNVRTPSLDGFIATQHGENIPVDARIICLVTLNKQITGYIISASDMRITRQLMKEISDREYAARELTLSESKFSRMFVFNPTGILIVSLETLKITDANPAIEEILECESSTLIGKTLEDIGLEMKEMPFEIFIEKIIMEGTVSEFGATIVLGPEKIRKCHLSAVSFDMKGKGQILLSVVDVTNHENMCAALTKKQKVETIGLLAGGIAHDFNNILAVILGHVGLAKMRAVDPHIRAPIEKAEQACLRAREMTGQLLIFSRGGKPIIAVCDAKPIITDSAMLSVHDTSVACLFNIDKDLWPLKADKIQIGQVITNLVGNAVQAMDKSGIIEIQARNRDFKNLSVRRRPLSLDSKPLAPGEYVEIRVKDQGPGIPAAVRSRMFDPFFTTKEKGTGLGLAIVYSIIQNHLGTITVESREGEGTTFSILLPADSSEAEAAIGVKAESAAGKPSDLPGVRKRVLLMDDDPLVRETASSMLSTLGCEVTGTEEGSVAASVYREALQAGKAFDFCILDLMISGGKNGLECAKEILSIDISAVLLVSSGYSDDPVLSHYQDYGFRGIIPKPYTLEELRLVLRNVLVV